MSSKQIRALHLIFILQLSFNGSSGVGITSGKFNPARGAGDRSQLPQRVRAQPGGSTIGPFLHFGLKKASDGINFTCIFTNATHSF